MRRKSCARVKQSQIVSLHDYLRSEKNHPYTEPELDIDRICTKYNITNLIPKSTKWITLPASKAQKKLNNLDPFNNICADPSISTPVFNDNIDPQNFQELSPPVFRVAEPTVRTRVKCKICHKILKCRKSLKRHQRLFHQFTTATSSNSNFSCDTCGNRFTSKEILHCHERIHAKRRKFGCRICGLRFVSQNEATLHMRAHTGERPFGCLVCGTAFRHGPSLTLHMKWQHQSEIKSEEPEVITIE